MAPPFKAAEKKFFDDGRFSYPPELAGKVRALSKARKLSGVIQAAIQAAPWPVER